MKRCKMMSDKTRPSVAQVRRGAHLKFILNGDLSAFTSLNIYYLVACFITAWNQRVKESFTLHSDVYFYDANGSRAQF